MMLLSNCALKIQVLSKLEARFLILLERRLIVKRTLMLRKEVVQSDLGQNQVIKKTTLKKGKN